METLLIQTDISIALASLEDVTEIYLLNTKWYKDNLSTLENGFLSVIYSREQISEIVQAGEAFVVKLNEKVAGYCLLNNLFRTEHTEKVLTQYYKNMQERLISTIGLSCQIVLDSELQNKGNFSLVLEECVIKFKERYDYVVTTISKMNIKSLKANKNFGWRQVAEMDDLVIVEI